MLTPADFRRCETLHELSDDELTALAEVAEEVCFEPGEVVFRAGQTAEWMFFVLEGDIAAVSERDGQEVGAFSFAAGDITGKLPHSRMKNWAGTGRAVERVRLARVHERHFDGLLERVPPLEPLLVGVMTDRVRDFTRSEQQRDRLMALGKLAAGLAHELNNPAAAMKRGAADLRERLDALPSLVRALATHGLDPDQLTFACTLGTQVAESRRTRLSTVAQAEREDEIADWLDEHEVEHGHELAPTFVEAGMTTGDLDRIATNLPPQALSDVVRWTEASVAADLLLQDITSAADRISGLVQSVKGYSRMDQARTREQTDVHEGLDSTLTMLAYEIRQRGVEVTRDYSPDLPRIEAYPGELNQVWTNLLHNALDAMPEGGELRIVSRPAGDAILVEIIDTGKGIPEELQGRIFEPFFTTKGVGEGTGLGLDVVQRIVTQSHRGQISVESEPGCTNFTVRLPRRAPIPVGRDETSDPGES